MINVACKLFMMLERDCINGLVEESGILGDIQDVFIRGAYVRDYVSEYI